MITPERYAFFHFIRDVGFFIRYNTMSTSEMTFFKGFIVLQPFFRCVDKMPTGQNANRTKCQPRLAFCPGLFFHGWHFVRTNFLVGILSGPSQHVLASPPQHQRVGGSCNIFLFAVDCCGGEVDV